MNFTEGFQSFAAFTLFLNHLSVKTRVINGLLRQAQEGF